MSPSEDDIRVGLVTAPDADTAARIGAALVEARLAACVNVLPGVRSIYRWEGRTQDDAEVLMVVKTRADRAAAAAERVVSLHPYDVPEVVWLAVESGHAPYLDWVRGEVAP